MEEQLGEASTKVAEYEVAIATLQINQGKLQSENADLSSQLGDAESKNGSLSKTNTNLSAHLDETKSELEMEVSVSGELVSSIHHSYSVPSETFLTSCNPPNLIYNLGTALISFP